MSLFRPNVQKLKVKKDVKGLVRALAHKDCDVKVNAAKALGALRDPLAVPELGRSMHSWDSGLMRVSAQALGHIATADAAAALLQVFLDRRCSGDGGRVQEAVASAFLENKDSTEPHLVAALGHTDADHRWAAALMMGVTRNVKGVEPLVATLNDLDEHVRSAAAAALGQIGDGRAAGALCPLLRDESSAVRKSAADALSKIGVPADPSIRAWHAVAQKEWDHAVSMGATAVEPLIAALRDPTWLVSYHAEKCLAAIGAPAVEQIVTLGRNLKYADAATNVLVAMGQADVSPLLALLRSSDEHEVRFAAYALYKIAPNLDRSGHAWLFAATGEWDKAVSLGIDARDPLVVALKRGPSGARNAAAEALAKIGVPENPSVQAWFAVAMQDWDRVVSLGDLAVEPLVSFVPSEEIWHKRAGALSALARIGNRVAIGHLISGLQTAEGHDWDSFVFALAHVGSAAVEPLIELLNANAAGSRGAAKALGHIGDIRAVQPLIRALDTMSPSREVAEALVAFYRSGKLDAISQQEILAQRGRIHHPHEDSGPQICQMAHRDISEVAL